MVSHDDLVQLWGAANVVRVDASAHHVTLPGDAVEILSEVGLPRRVEPLFEIADLVMVEAPGRGGRFCRFGTDFGTDLCVSSETGEVLALSLSGEYPDRFVNTSLAAFIECLVRVTAERSRFLDLGDDQIDQIIVELDMRLRRLDEQALADPDNWWSVLVEQMRDGLL